MADQEQRRDEKKLDDTEEPAAKPKHSTNLPLLPAIATFNRSLICQNAVIRGEAWTSETRI